MAMLHRHISSISIIPLPMPDKASISRWSRVSARPCIAYEIGRRVFTMNSPSLMLVKMIAPLRKYG